MKDVRRDFLQATGRTSITGIPFGVMAVLIAECAYRVIAGYQGASSRFDGCIHEAIGLQLGATPQQALPDVPERYSELVGVIREVLWENAEATGYLDAFLKQDQSDAHDRLTGKQT
jgi:hypothetical protein